MKPSLFAWSLWLLLLTACHSNDTFTLTGEIKGLQAGKKVGLIPIDFDYKKEKLDTLFSTIAQDGRFELKGKTPKGLLIAYRLVFEGEKNQRYPMLFLESEKMRIEGELSHLRDCKISGSLLNEELERLMTPFKESERAYEHAEQSHSESGKKEALEQMRRALYSVPLENNKSLIAPFLILVTTGKQGAEFRPIYEKFTEEVKNSFYGRVLEEHLPTDFVGQPIKAIELNDRTGQPIPIKQVLGKCTLVDFWASWCGPCRRSIPALRDLYTKYHDQGFEIYSISLDRDSAQWTQALDEEKMPWPNVIDRDDEQGVSVAYEVKFIPHCLLVGSDGKVIAVNPDAEQLERLIVEQLTQK